MAEASYVAGEDLERDMVATLLFMPELGQMSALVLKEIIRRCVRVAIMHGARVGPEVQEEVGR